MSKIIGVIVVLALVAVGVAYFTGVWNPRNPTKLDTSKLKTDKKKLKDPYAEGARQIQLQKWDYALESYETALSSDPNDHRAPLAMYIIGLCYEERGDKEDAIAAYKAFLKKYPKHKKSPHARKRLSNKFGVTAK